MSDEIVISIDDITKDFALPHEKINSVKGVFTSLYKRKSKQNIETQHALKNITFNVKKGEFFGIVGRNGSGKSTLLKILAGIYQPTSGTVNVIGKLVPFIELGVGFNPELTGRENVFLNGAMLGFSRKEVEEMYNDIVEFAEIERFMDQKLKNYSSGMQVRLAFSMATRAKADILLVDEVLAVGDADFQRKCFDYFRSLKSAGTTVIFVTHDMNAAREYCDKAILINDSKLVEEGSASKVAASYTRMFIEESTTQRKDERNEKRWGDGTIMFTDIEIIPKTIRSTDDRILIKLHAKASVTVSKPIFGFLIKNGSFVHILGTNSQIIDKPIDELQAGERVEIVWEIPNILNDGVHYVDPAVVYKGGVQVADWWEEATSFRVLKEERTPYLVNPNVSFKISNLPGKDA